MTESAPPATPPHHVRFRAYALVIFERAGADVGWCVWVEKTTWSDGTVTTEYKSAKDTPA